jgi:hypothetical protein
VVFVHNAVKHGAVVKVSDVPKEQGDKSTALLQNGLLKSKLI